jgi:hypothetical protein
VKFFECLAKPKIVLIMGEQITMMKDSTQPLPASGGASIASVLLPATAFVIGCGVLAYAMFRYR